MGVAAGAEAADDEGADAVGATGGRYAFFFVFLAMTVT
jgi:hypothetical protein